MTKIKVFLQISLSLPVHNTAPADLLTPAQAWSDEEYQLRIAVHVEDTAGNNLLGPLETDLALPSAVSPTGPANNEPRDRSLNQRKSGYVTLPLVIGS